MPMSEGDEEEVACSRGSQEVALHTIVINTRDLPEMSQHSQSEDFFIDCPMGDSPLRDLSYRLEHRLIKKLYHRQVDSLNLEPQENLPRGDALTSEGPTRL